MELQQQVTNLELSKRMKELGFKQKSFARWEVYTDPNTNRKKKLIVLQGGHTFGDVYSAYTVSELGEMLPKECKSFKEGKDFYWACERIGADKYRSVSGGNTEADARAKMLIYLKENNLL